MDIDDVGVDRGKVSELSESASMIGYFHGGREIHGFAIKQRIRAENAESFREVAK